MNASKTKSDTARIALELGPVLVVLRRFISAKEKMELLEQIPDISALSAGSAAWFFAPLDEETVAPTNMRKFISAIESIYCGVECGHFDLSPDMQVYTALVYLLCERIGGSATSMASHAVDQLLPALDHCSCDKALVTTTLLRIDRQSAANADSDVSEWQRLLIASGAKPS